ncbi:MAG: CDP-diacylglycerol--glycerol-3-phosphate 3-phosphatidyltransferase [Candidatus Hydrogenedentes bacterium]|nr:CDP-diacylglycerol--glycerol-3-phosphate 3-phosphatidyltransferase [Candidatus Hydrogenedentota bacterium]
MTINLPNKLTIFRLMLVPVFITILSLEGTIPSFPAYLLALIVFIAGVVTDYYDGKLARKHGLITNFGKLFDPVADKVLICSAFVMFITIKELMFPAWAVILVLFREFVITGLRALAASEGHVLGAERWGKVKAGWQMACVITALTLLTIRSLIQLLSDAGYFDATSFMGYYDRGMRIVVWILIAIVLYLTVVSGIQHLIKNRDFFFRPGQM